MATYNRFEDLPVWRAAMELAEGCEDLLLATGRLISRGKADQLDRASLSVSNNIAEGFERGTTPELLQFLYIARGSAGEVRSMLHFFQRRPALVAHKTEISILKALAESCGRQIRAWADHLQNTDIQGQRRLNDQTRAQYVRGKEQAASALEFTEMQRRMVAKLPREHPLRQQFEQKHGPIPEV